MRVRFFGTDAFRNASRQKMDLLIEVAIRYVWRARRPRSWPRMRKRKWGKKRRLHWREATVLLILMYNLKISYRGIERFLDSRSKLLRRLRLQETPNRVTLNNAYWRLDRRWFMDLNDRITARVEWEAKRRKMR
jgi:hypothetical protein